MNIINDPLTTGALPKWVAAAAVAISLMIPLSASANHERNEALELVVTAAIAYAIFDAVGDFDDERYYRRHSNHRYHDDHYNRHDRYRGHKRHHRAHGKHRRHDRHGYRNKKHNGYRSKHKRHGDRYYAARY
jgi:hypothetical protein